MFQTLTTISGPGSNFFNLDILMREAAAGVTGNVFIDVYFLPIGYGPDGCGEFPSGRNENDRVSIGGWQHLFTKVQSLSTSWQSVNWGPGSTTTASGYLLVRVRSAALLNGSPASIHLDTAHLERN